MSNNYLRNCSRKGKTARITISIESQIEEKISEISEMMSKCTGEDWSMSKVVNMVLLGGILAPTSLGIYEWGVVKQFAQGRKVNLRDSKIDEYITNLVALRNIV